MENSSEPFQR